MRALVRALVRIVRGMEVLCPAYWHVVGVHHAAHV